MRRRDLIALSGAIALGIAGCLGRDEGGHTVAAAIDASDARAEPTATTAEIEELAAANSAFALDLYHELLAQEPGSNHFVSPFSISMALAMTWAGARGETADAMAETLRFPFEQDTLHAVFNGLDMTLDRRSDVETGDDEDPPELNIANALWPDEDFTLDASFEETMARQYGARPHALDFDAEAEAAETINAWVAHETENRIDDLIAPGHLAQTRLVLTNAIYFLAAWMDEFEERHTEERAFTALDGSSAPVQMMSQIERFPYAEADGHQAIELPYVGGELSMLVVLPALDSFEDFEGSLDPDALGVLIDALEETPGRIELPRFELETSYELPTHFESLGMELAFTPEADFSGMGPGLWIGNIVHDAFVSVDEEGTEAAAATAVMMDDSGPPPAEFEMTVDRPFIFVIRDRPTDSVLFLGRVIQPPADPRE